jgi:hypothetical protein
MKSFMKQAPEHRARNLPSKYNTRIEVTSLLSYGTNYKESFMKQATRGLYYKTFYGHNLRSSVIS